MQERLWILILTVTAILLATGCQGGSTANVQNPPPPPPNNVSISFQTAPPAGIVLNGNAPVAAAVSNDPNNYGVDWALAIVCQGPNCGPQPCADLLNPTDPCGTLHNSSGQLVAHSNSGDMITYYPPTTFLVPGNVMTVQINAYATADQTKNVSASLAITAFGTVLNGTYVFQAKGSDSNGSPYQIAGVATLDGTNDACSGFITSGQQTINTVSAGSVTTPISGSTNSSCGPSAFFVGSDGRGSITLATTDQNNSPVTETFGLVVLSTSQAQIAELDSSSASGTLELQTSTAMPTGGYAFVASGTDSSVQPIAVGGVVNIDSPGGISGNGSLADQFYLDTFTTCAPSQVTGTVSSTNTPGVVAFNLTSACSGINPFGPTQLTGYIVDPTHIRIIETDDIGGAGGYLTSGLAVGQGSAAGTFTNASFSGTYVYNILGMDATSLLPSSLTSLGTFTADGNGNITSGIMDTALFQNFAGNPTQVTASFTTTYAADIHGIGRVRLGALHFNQPQNNFGPRLFFYLTGNGTPPLMFYGEDFKYPASGVGSAYSQAALPISFSGNYGVGFTQQNGGENDGSGQITVAVNGNAGTLTGLVDEFSNIGSPPFSVSDTFTLPTDSLGRAAGTFLSGAGEYYLVDSGHAFFTETDLVNPGSGQMAIGYFAQKCDVTTGCAAPGQKSVRKHASKHGSHGPQAP